MSTVITMFPVGEPTNSDSQPMEVKVRYSDGSEGVLYGVTMERAIPIALAGLSAMQDGSRTIRAYTDESVNDHAITVEFDITSDAEFAIDVLALGIEEATDRYVDWNDDDDAYFENLLG